MNKQSEALDRAASATEAPPSVTLIGPVTSDVNEMANGRRERRPRKDAGERHNRESRRAERNEAAATDGAPGDAAASRPSRTERRARKGGPRAPRAERAAAPPADGEAAAEGENGAEETDAEAIDAALLLGVTGRAKRAERTLQRARKKQESATAAVENAEDNPALGALNRHLNMLMQQLATAHRVIGRVAAERDALRQQLADMQGVSVDEIKVTSVGATAEPGERPATPHHHAHAASPAASPSPLMSKLNYFGGEDIARMRRRRQIFVLILLGIIGVLYWASRMGYWAMPDNLSRDSLGSLPYVGELMTYFLAGWMFFRVFRVSSKGVRWVFPSEDSRRRRR